VVIPVLETGHGATTFSTYACPDHPASSRELRCLIGVLTIATIAVDIMPKKQ
jgi:hypothetical protein